MHEEAVLDPLTESVDDGTTKAPTDYPDQNTRENLGAKTNAPKRETKAEEKLELQLDKVENDISSAGYLVDQYEWLPKERNQTTEKEVWSRKYKQFDNCGALMAMLK